MYLVLGVSFNSLNGFSTG